MGSGFGSGQKRAEFGSIFAVIADWLTHFFYWKRRLQKAATPQLVADAQKIIKMVYAYFIVRTNIDVDESLVRQARRLTGLKTKRQIVDKALELLVRSESRKGILRYYGSGIWKGDQKAARRNRT